MAHTSYPQELIESGRELPYLGLRKLPTDEELTASLIAAGFTHCFGVPYNGPKSPMAVTTTEAKRNIREFPRPGRKKHPYEAAPSESKMWPKGWRKKKKTDD